jgi:hypothetical protein
MSGPVLPTDKTVEALEAERHQVKSLNHGIGFAALSIPQ